MTATHVFNPPPGARSATVRVRDTPRGTGGYARPGVGTPVDKEISFRITSALPNASVSTSLTNFSVVDEDDCQVLIANASGNHDLIELEWEIEAGEGCLVEWFPKNPARAPTTRINPVATIDEDECAVVIVTPSGGDYDEREYGFEVVSGGCFVPYFVKREIVPPTNVDIDVTFLRQDGQRLTNPALFDENDCAVVIVTPSGGMYDERDYEFEVVSADGCFVDYFVKRDIRAPTTSLSPIATFNEDECAVVIATPSGGAYDVREYGWEVVSGPGCLVPYFVKAEIAAPRITVSNPRSISEEDAIVIDITPSGGMYDVIEYAGEVVSGIGCLVPYVPRPAAAPSITFERSFIETGETASITAIPTGGFYDSIVYSWRMVGEPEPIGAGATLVFDAAEIEAGTDINLTLVVTVEGRGVFADQGTEAMDTVELSFEVQLPIAIAPFTTMTNICLLYTSPSPRDS